MDEHGWITIPARMDQVHEACGFVARVAARHGMDDEGVYRCQLSVEEICTNIVEHGYENVERTGKIEIWCFTHNETFIIEVIDDAPLFNPLGLPKPDPSTPLWERSEGGWGIQFVRRFMDRVEYSDSDSRNHFRMEKRLS
ncbi:MAG: ATP-binding protein [Chloroflexi bacterium]|nr:MAG: anti-sigma-factor antagonist [Chloroflexi bacterium OLB13]MBV6435824.1 hypothetical protein [Anaerolineae bacterium]MCC6564184.1 ATP-binding protein [Chloroflexota bacterium]MDL1915975.1 ATP-binding protein [Anaerolineae bacterium CFX4]MBW7879249.1 ATP-binding protein [Anaerolineae bacterium]